MVFGEPVVSALGVPLVFGVPVVWSHLAIFVWWHPYSIHDTGIACPTQLLRLFLTGAPLSAVHRRTLHVLVAAAAAVVG